MSELLGTAGKIAGIGGIALAVFLLLFREVIRKQIFPQLTKPHAYQLIRQFMYLTFVVAVLGIVAWFFGKRSAESSERPYVFPVTAFWRNGLTEAVVQFKNSGNKPAYRNRTQIHFFATSERSDSQELDWDHILPAVSDNTMGPGEMYNTAALTRLNTVSGAEAAVLTGNAVAYVYGVVRYKDSPDSKSDLSDRFCWMYDASRSQAFFGCPAAALQ
jgi:ABC-type multidrug transport system fused ATPase/permease subunit